MNQAQVRVVDVTVTVVPADANWAVMFLALLAAALGLFLLVVALIAVIRWQARRALRREKAAEADAPDAWQEAGRRIQP